MKKLLAAVLSFFMIFGLVRPVFAAEKTITKENEEIEVAKITVTAEEQKKLDNLPVEIKAKSAILIEVSSGEVLLEYNADTKLFPASVTKIMTMLLVAEAVSDKKITLADKVSCSANAASKGGSQIWLEEGEVMTVDELLRATAIGSANDAATLLGEYVAGSETAFIDLMNARAKELKMKNTHFENATGLDDTTDSHLTTAKDIAVMSRELLKHDFIRDYTTVWMDSLRDGKTELVNTNKLVRFYSGATGLKTGTTAKAGCCISASAERDGLHLIAVVMGSDNSNDRFNTAKSMLNWGFSNYSCVTVPINKNDLKDIKVIGGKCDYVTPELPEIAPVLVKKGEVDRVKADIKTEEVLEAPVTENQTVGTVTVSVADKTVAKYKITAKSAVDKLGFFGYLKKLANFVANGEKAYPDYTDNAR